VCDSRHFFVVVWCRIICTADMVFVALQQFILHCSMTTTAMDSLSIDVYLPI